MLIPAFYLQAISGKGILKKKSFTAINSHFSKRELAAIEQASEIRERWCQKIGLTNSYLFSKGFSLRYLITRYIKIQPYEELAQFFNAKNINNLMTLLEKMEVNLSLYLKKYNPNDE